MKTIKISQSIADTDSSEMIEKAINEASAESTVVFEKGTYFLSKAVCIKGKKELIIDGTGVVLAPFFDRSEGADTGSDVFHLSDCENITIIGFTICSPVPVNSAGTIIDVTEEYADVEMTSSVPLTGNEQFIDGGTFDENRNPMNHYWVFDGYDETKRTIIAGEIPCTAPKKLDTPHKMIGDQTVRVFSKRLVALKPGMYCCISHSYYGLCAFVFRQCKGIIIEDVKITNFAGFGFLILPHCKDFVFRRVTFASADRIHQPLALNSDGIHIKGLSGSLVMEGCEFDCIADDVLNVHTQVMTVTDVKDDKIKLVYNKIGGVVSPYWCEKGDKLRIYDPNTLVLKGKVAVLSSCRGDILIEHGAVDIRKGDLVTNDKYYPDVTIQNCNFYGCRTRTLCLQGTNSLTLQKCTFNNVSKKTIYCTTAFDHWQEAGPLCNVTIKDNVFYGTKGWYGAGSVIHVDVSGSKYQNISPLHKNISIENNCFKNIAGRPIEIHLTDGVTVKNNVFENCVCNAEKILVEKSINIVCSNNTSF